MSKGWTYYVVTVVAESGKKKNSFAFAMRNEENLWSVMCGLITDPYGKPRAAVEWLSSCDTKTHAATVANAWNEQWKARGIYWEDAPVYYHAVW